MFDVDQYCYTRNIALGTNMLPMFLLMATSSADDGSFIDPATNLSVTVIVVGDVSTVNHIFGSVTNSVGLWTTTTAPQTPWATLTRTSRQSVCASTTFPSYDSSSPKFDLRGTVDAECVTQPDSAGRGQIYLSRAAYSQTVTVTVTDDD